MQAPVVLQSEEWSTVRSTVVRAPTPLVPRGTTHCLQAVWVGVRERGRVIQEWLNLHMHSYAIMEHTYAVINSNLAENMFEEMAVRLTSELVSHEVCSTVQLVFGLFTIHGTNTVTSKQTVWHCLFSVHNSLCL